MDWGNLVEWCRAVWAGEASRVRAEFGTGAERAVVALAHCIAFASRGENWEVCWGQLEAVRIVAGYVDDQWLM